MTNRRNFIGSLGLILTAAASPAIFVPKIEPIHWRLPQIRQLKANWSMELEGDLAYYHNINVAAELRALFIDSIKTEYPGVNVVDVRYDEKLSCSDHEGQWCWCYSFPRRVAIATLDRPVHHAPIVNKYLEVV